VRERARAVAERWEPGWLDQDPARCLTKPMPLQCSKKKTMPLQERTT